MTAASLPPSLPTPDATVPAGSGSPGALGPRALLSVRNLQVSYGGISALRGIDFEVFEGEVVSLIGANGAGKSTTLRAISRIVNVNVKPTTQLRFGDTDLLGLKPEAVVKAGIAHSPEGRRVLTRLSVEDNLTLGAYIRNDRDEIVADLAAQFRLFPRLEERRNQLAGTLSGGEQQMLAIARALMSRPRLLLLDEPSLGLAPIIVESIFQIIDDLRSTGVTILLIEQNANLALKHSDRAYVLEAGNIVTTGNASDLLADEAVRAAYLG